jgi:hypothetical protein
MRIADEFLQCSVFIYPSRDAADEGKWLGGSGCLVNYEWVEGGSHRHGYFVVTNRHVIDKLQSPVVRLNRLDGKVEIFETSKERWWTHPENDDIAAMSFDFLGEEHAALAINERAFIRSEIIEMYNIGIGDHVAMIGRLVEHDGKSKNLPAVRFGGISMMNNQTLKNAFGKEQETFLIDCPSLAGFSGSPVIVYLPTTARSKEALLNQGLGPWLLGLDWMHVSEHIPLREAEKDTKIKDYYVQGNSGIAGVIPAWRISQLLRTMVNWDTMPATNDEPS